MFDQSSISDVKRPEYSVAGVHLSWTSWLPSGTTYQVYADGRLVYHGTSRFCDLPPVPAGTTQHFDVGAVDAGEAFTDFSSSLSAVVARRAYLSWLGGTYLDATGNDDVAGFRIYGEHVAQAGIDYTKPLVEIPAYFNGVITDGFGEGGFGQGGFGRSASSYSWTSGPLTTGQWSFAVRSVDGSGNEGTAIVSHVSISIAPAPPPMYPDGERVHYSWDPTTHQIVLMWQPSPG